MVLYSDRLTSDDIKGWECLEKRNSIILLILLCILSRYRAARSRQQHARALRQYLCPVAEVEKMPQFRPLRFLRRSVSVAVRSVGIRLGGAVRFAFPGKARRRGHNLTNEAAWSAVVKNYSFADEVCDDPERKHCKSLLTVGSRQWGNWWDGRGLLKVKVYEFAIYANKQQLRKSQLSRTIRHRGSAVLTQAGFFNQLRSSDDVDMSIHVKASRDLPLKSVTGEYEKVLRRRLERVGGKNSDAALPKLISLLNEKGSNKQSGKTDKESVKQGSIIQFQKNKSGYLTTVADKEVVGTVHSPDLCAALFDLYLGEEPVSEKAKLLAGKRILDFVLDKDQSPKHTASIPTPSVLKPLFPFGKWGACDFDDFAVIA